MNEIERAICILELMAIDLTGTLGGLSETNPLCDVVKQRIAAIDAAQDALREKSGRENRKTNADRIRSMSDEELAEFITLSPEMEFDVCLCCKNGNPYPDDRGICLTKHGHCEAEARCEALKDWLQQPVKEK